VSGQVYAYGRFTTRDRGPGTHNIGGWVGCRTVVDILKKSREIFLCRKSNPVLRRRVSHTDANVMFEKTVSVHWGAFVQPLSQRTSSTDYTF